MQLIFLLTYGNKLFTTVVNLEVNYCYAWVYYHMLLMLQCAPTYLQHILLQRNAYTLYLILRNTFFCWRKVLLINFLTWASGYDLMIMIIRQNDIKQTLSSFSYKHIILLYYLFCITREALNIKWWNWSYCCFFIFFNVLNRCNVKNVHILQQDDKVIIPLLFS